MARKIIAKNEALSGTFLMLSGAAFGASAAWSLGYPASNGASLGLTAGTGIFFWQQITGRGFSFGRSGKVKTRRRQFASMSPWSIKEGIDKDGIFRWHDKRDKPPEQFIFQSDILPTDIPESMMYRFCERALQRNRIVLDPERTTYKRTGFKLRSHEVLSEPYFTTKITPRFLPTQYAAIIQILEMTGYLINRRGGHGGELFVDYSMSPQKMVHRVRWGWIDIIVRADNAQAKPFWKRAASPH